MIIRTLTALVWFVVSCGSVEDLQSEEFRITVSVVDADSRVPIPSRIYLKAIDGKPFFFTSSSDKGTSVRYEKQNWLNKESVEYHSTVSAHPCFASVPPGTYSLIVERGKSYFPYTQELDVTDADLKVSVALKRWNDPAARGWYSGDMHIHRTIDDLSNVVLAEDLNVVFPLTNWVTLSDTPPSAGDKNLDIALPEHLVRIDDQHVIWPRNTEYEIFRVGKKRHTLGALFVLGHEGALQQTVPPWKPVIEAARKSDPDILFDMDKLAWPFAMVLPTIAPDATYELANNHMWRTEFAFRKWYTPSPPFIAPPYGGTEGGEREWIEFTLGMYYVLLDCGYRMPPSAGSANGVHPVPAGFSRVYVHQPDGFDYQKWREGLQKGRSFVTTGPMLYATANQKDPGHVFEFEDSHEIPLHVEIISETPLSYGEILVNGTPKILLRPQNQRTQSGAYRSVIDSVVKPTRSGWFAIRFWEDRPGNRVRFAHTAPWYVDVDRQPVLPRQDEKQYLVRRMLTEIERSRGVVSPEGMAEYEDALKTYESLEVQDDSALVTQIARPLADTNRDRWLTNMIVDHQFTADEVRLATGLSIADATTEFERWAPLRKTSDPAKSQIRILPYPGGRHPRRGFLDGAINPERETKISVFPPWKDGGYAVVDVPEAIFSNLGLTYLAHQHIPTIWSQQSIQLQRLEWYESDGGLEFKRKLPNGIEFGSRVIVENDAVELKMSLTNGTTQPLAGLRSQVCVMLKGLTGFSAQRKREQIMDGPFVAVKADRSQRWIITAWKPLKRTWTNPPVPCIHSDPIFPDCKPNETVHVRGRLWFYEGPNIRNEIDRLKRSFER